MSNREEQGEMREASVTKPNPDPTYATLAAVEQSSKSERDYVDGQIAVVLQRLDGIDTATRLLQVTADRVPDHIAKVVSQVRELVDEKFHGVKTQFVERDIRAEREARDNKVAVDAAFAAQKEAAAKQDEANAKAIDKSERATAETIKTNSELSRTTNDALRGQIDDLKERVSREESRKEGAAESRVETRASISNTGTIVGIVGGIVALIAVVSALYLGARSPEPVVVQPTVTTPAP